MQLIPGQLYLITGKEQQVVARATGNSIQGYPLLDPLEWLMGGAGEPENRLVSPGPKAEIYPYPLAALDTE